MTVELRRLRFARQDAKPLAKELLFVNVEILVAEKYDTALRDSSLG